MSILADFGAGFFEDAYQQKANKNREKAELLRRAEERAKEREDFRYRLLAEQEISDKNVRQGEGFNPETGMIEWINADGTPGSRKATAAEIQEHKARLAAAETEGLLQDLGIKRTQAQIAADEANVRLRDARAANVGKGRTGASEEDFKPKPVPEPVALAALGVRDFSELTTKVDRDLFFLLLSGQLAPNEVETMRPVLNRRDPANNIDWSIGDRLPR